MESFPWKRFHADCRHPHEHEEVKDGCHHDQGCRRPGGRLRGHRFPGSLGQPGHLARGSSHRRGRGRPARLPAQRPGASPAQHPHRVHRPAGVGCAQPVLRRPGPHGRTGGPGGGLRHAARQRERAQGAAGPVLGHPDFQAGGRHRRGAARGRERQHPFADRAQDPDRLRGPHCGRPRCAERDHGQRNRHTPGRGAPGRGRPHPHRLHLRPAGHLHRPGPVRCLHPRGGRFRSQSGPGARVLR